MIADAADDELRHDEAEGHYRHCRAFSRMKDDAAAIKLKSYATGRP